MATYEDELKDLKEQNNELAQKVQYWKMTSAQRDDEKLALMKENNDLRLKLSRLSNTGGLRARKLDTALQAASEKAISHLVKASTEIAKGMEMVKEYMRDLQELDIQSPRWSSIGGTPTKEKSDRVHRVQPMVGGQSIIQPVISLRRTVLNTSNPRSTSRSPNHNQSLTERAVPMHMLQDVYIPLTRIDVSDLPNNSLETETETNNADDSAANLGLDDDNESDDSDMSVDDHEYDATKLQPVEEEEPEVRPSMFPVRELPIRNLRLHINPRYEQEDRLWNIEHAKWREERQRLASQQASQRNSQEASRQDTQQASQQDSQQNSPQDNQQGSEQESRKTKQQDTQKSSQQDSQKANKQDTQRYSRGDPLEGPSWLLDQTPPDPKPPSTSKSRVTLEPDSTTELDDSARKAADTSGAKVPDNTETECSPLQSREFSPTVRRRKRTSSPPSPRAPHCSPPSPRAPHCSPPSPRAPHYSPRPAPARRTSTSGRVLKVLVAKMRLEPARSPPKRARSPSQSPLLAFDAPSPNGATDSRVIVYESRTTPPDSEITTECDTRTTSPRESHDSEHHSRGNSQQDGVTHRRRPSQGPPRGGAGRGRRLHSQDGRDSRQEPADSRDSDSSAGAGDELGEGRTRRARKAVIYKEKPLNRKLRR